MQPQRHLILLPMRGAPRLLPAASSPSLRVQVEDLCGGHVVSTPAPEWRGDRHRLVLIAHPRVGTEASSNALAGRVLGVPMHGPCVLARRPADDGQLYREPRPGDRFALPLETAEAREILADLGREIEEMHHA